MTIHEQIKTARERKKWSMEKLAAEVSEVEGLTKPLTWQTVQQWENGKSAPKRTRMEIVSRLLGLAESVPALFNEETEGGYAVPVLSASASMGSGADQHDDVVVGRMTLSPTWINKSLKSLTKPENLRFIHGYGDSMEPTFVDGDIMLVDAGVRSCDVDGIYVLQTNNRLFIKRVTERFDGAHEITSDNPKVKTVQLLDGSHEVEVLGRIVWVWNGKKI